MNRNDQQFLIQKIRTQYMEKESTDIDMLKSLDAKVKLPANIFAYAFGSLGAIIMGAGMSLVMTEIGKSIGVSHPILWGVIIGVIGLGAVVVNYPIYKRILEKRKNQYAKEIIELSDKIIGE